MTKLSINRVFETSRLFSTKAGTELRELIAYTADLAEQVIRTLRKGVGVADNLDADLLFARVVSGTEFSLAVSKTPIALIPARVQEQGATIDSCGWYFNSQGQLRVKVTITGTSATYGVNFLAIYS